LFVPLLASDARLIRMVGGTTTRQPNSRCAEASHSVHANLHVAAFQEDFVADLRRAAGQGNNHKTGQQVVVGGEQNGRGGRTVTCHLNLDRWPVGGTDPHKLEAERTGS
jgi:hypothetical protein